MPYIVWPCVEQILLTLNGVHAGTPFIVKVPRMSDPQPVADLLFKAWIADEVTGRWGASQLSRWGLAFQ
jgi:hypothetical protein